MSEMIEARTLHEDHEDETRIVELSSSYEGTSGCYHWLSRKLVIFEQNEVVVQWHNGTNAPVDVRLTFAELDALIEQFNSYCEDYDHTLPDEVFTPVTGFSVFASPACTGQDVSVPFYPFDPSTPLALVQVAVPTVVAEHCDGTCWICGNPCAKPENHYEICYCPVHT